MSASCQDHPTEWVFISTSPAHRRASKAQRSQMRQRVMRELGYSRRKVRKLAESSDASSTKTTSTSSGSEIATAESLSGASPSLLSFVLNPITLDESSRRLLQHMFSDAIPTRFRIYRDRWYPACTTNAAAFDQMLATYATHLSRYMRDQSYQHFILSNHSKALSSVCHNLNALLGGDKQALGGVVCAITALACYSHLSDDMLTWQSHMTAAVNLIGESFNQLDSKVQELVRWVEYIGSYALDIPPVLGIFEEADSYNHFADESLSFELSTIEISAPLVSALKLLQWTNSYLHLQESVLSEPTKLDRLIHPTVHRFLALPCRAHDFSPICSCIRSGALLYLAEFRRKSGVSPVNTGLHLQRLGLSMETFCQTLVAPKLTLWLLTVGSIEAIAPADQDYFYRRLSMALLTLGVSSVQAWTQLMREVIWLDWLFCHKLDKLWSILTG